MITDKGNSTVVMQRDDYTIWKKDKKFHEMLTDDPTMRYQAKVNKLVNEVNQNKIMN